MSKLILEFPLPLGAVAFTEDSIVVDLGNGVRLRSSIPEWVKAVRGAKLILEMDIEGSPPNANPGETPIERIHETPTDGGLKVRQNGKPGTPNEEV
jgi:hypothetical protein